jgi:uncharacterized protein YjbI with pentapeptide repeats
MKQGIKLTKPKCIDNITNIDGEAISNIYDEDEIEHIYISNNKIKNQIAYQVSFKEVVFDNVTFENIEFKSLDCTDVRFINCDLSNVDFSGAIIHRTEFINCKLMGINLSNAALQNVLIKECNGKFAFMRFVQIKKVIFEDSLLESSDFQSSELLRTSFLNCDLKLSQMCGTSLSGIDFSTSNIEGLGIRVEDIKGVIVSPIQAVDLSKLLGIIIKE